jgi:hypothetical protein
VEVTIRTTRPERSEAKDDWAGAMRAGDFARAWAINDRDLAALYRCGAAKHAGPRHLQRIWRGEPLSDRRVLVRCYHGLGDTLQFIRFMPALRTIAREVTVWCQPELLPIVERMRGVDRALPLHDGSPDADFDVDIEIMEVPHAIWASHDVVAMRRPYIEVGEDESIVMPGRSTELTVGLVWEVGDWDKRRAIPVALLQRLAGPGIRLHSLQRGANAVAAAQIGASDFSTPDICALARRLRWLDLLICVDTMVAHLAGALGCPAWVLLHADCDWRWPTVGERTVWYPTLRLFHQRVQGDWSDVIDRVALALRERARQRSNVEPVTSG